jgi:PAS domain S-box-containing protein
MADNQGFIKSTADILVVDDTIATLRLLTEILTGSGYKTRPVEDPRLALEAARAQPPSIILLDVRMPHMGGFELCRKLKQDERTREVPVIFVSALDELQDRIQGFEVGGVDYITKPIQEAEVLARVNTHLQLRNLLLHQERLVAEKTAELEQLLAERSRALRSAEAQIHSLFENSPIGISITTFTGEILTVNTALLIMLRISEQQLKEQGASQFYANPGDREKLLVDVQNKGSVQDFGIQLRRNNGELFNASINMSRLTLVGNEVLLTIIEDITDQIAAEHQAAVLTERTRLAQELHDSVTQSLYSARMIADATPAILEKDPALGKQNLVLLSDLMRGASAEMRNLLLELRPEALQNLSLSKLLESLVVSIQTRTRVDIKLEVDGDCLLPEEVKITLYRIAQEALNNVTKHAQANQVNIQLINHADKVVLKVTDNGRGFDPDKLYLERMGISIMRKRAEKIGAVLQIESNLGEGTLVTVAWPNNKDKAL